MVYDLFFYNIKYKLLFCFLYKNTFLIHVIFYLVYNACETDVFFKLIVYDSTRPGRGILHPPRGE